MPAPRKYTDLQKQWAYNLYHHGEAENRADLLEAMRQMPIIEGIDYYDSLLKLVEKNIKWNRSGDDKLSLKEISQITGVPAYYVCAIGKGYR